MSFLMICMLYAYTLKRSNGIRYLETTRVENGVEIKTRNNYEWTNEELYSQKVNSVSTQFMIFIAK